MSSMWLSSLLTSFWWLFASVVSGTFVCAAYCERRGVSGMTDGFDDATAYGFIDGLDDPSMGWARYAQATKHMNLNSGLFYVRASGNTVALMQRLADRLSRQKYWDQTAFNEEIFFLSHGETSFLPISVRVMDYWRFQNSKVRSKLQWLAAGRQRATVGI
jgi:hypothetical protein